MNAPLLRPCCLKYLATLATLVTALKNGCFLVVSSHIHVAKRKRQTGNTGNIYRDDRGFVASVAKRKKGMATTPPPIKWLKSAILGTCCHVASVATYFADTRRARAW